MMSNGQPTGPMYGRRPHDMPYNPPPLMYQHPYNGYPHQHLPQHYPQQPPPQWGYYNGMTPMQRPYPPYPPMMNGPYPMPQPPNPLSMSPRPGPPQHTPSNTSARSHQSFASPSVQTRPLQSPLPQPPNQPPTPMSRPAHPPDTDILAHRMPFYPVLPWHSVPKEQFPPRSRRRRRIFATQSSDIPVELPNRGEDGDRHEDQIQTSADIVEATVPRLPATEAQPMFVEPGMANAEIPSDAVPGPVSESTGPLTSSSTAPSRAVQAPSKHSTRAQPIVPVVPNIPSLGKAKKSSSSSIVAEPGKPGDSVTTAESDLGSVSNEQTTLGQSDADSSITDESQRPATTPSKAPPKSWADLVRNKAPNSAHPTPSNAASTANSGVLPLGLSESLADVLSTFEVLQADGANKISFLKPRGLINTGNMCYMNSVLQMLIFCVPFYNFLDHVGKHAPHRFKSDTPMLDAMIMFMREFPVIDSAVSAEQLTMRLKDTELEEYGDALIPEFVYDVIRRLPRFSSMRRGHQQDAEEFLGFLLEELHEECVRALKGPGSKGAQAGMHEALDPDGGEEDGWLEVGPKQRAAITRASGLTDVDSPIAKIFGGKLRSELRVPGAKNSVTLEPYQPLQLDIGSPQVNNIVDALRNLTKPERLHGAFNSPRGPGAHATKQVFIETLPPVLILHLKRFQYDNTGGTQKIWKKIGYPLELEVPKEVFPPHRRGGLSLQGGLPKYRLTGVVYHHGKIASGGHYTVDVRRQNDREWIRLDDTVMRRVRSEDVAEGGSEEDPRVLAAALEQHKRDQSSSSNIFDQVREEQEEQEQAEKGWSQVNGPTAPTPAHAKKRSGVVNGNATPTNSSGKETPVGRLSGKDNKVAYLLFYQRVG